MAAHMRRGCDRRVTAGPDPRTASAACDHGSVDLTNRGRVRAAELGRSVGASAAPSIGSAADAAPHRKARGTTVRAGSHLIAGAGLAGLSLACALLDEGVRGPITLIDRRTSFEPDRTWCMWDVGALRWRELARHRWHEWSIVTAGGSATATSFSHPYMQLDAADVYDAALARLAGAPNVELLLGTRVLDLGEDRGRAWVRTDRGELAGERLYDGMSLSTPAQPGPPRGDQIAIWQSFLGQVVDSPDPVFDAARCTLMDFRVAQEGEARFIYVLPYDSHRALLEHTSLGRSPVPHQLRRDALAAYLREHVGARSWSVEREERGRIPMTGGHFPVRRGPRTTAIGIAAGAARPSSGYAFVRTVTHADAVAHAVARGRTPPGRLAPRRLQSLDRIFLEALSIDPSSFPEYFRSLARKVPGDAFARFMDDAGSLADEIRVAAALPSSPFAAAASRVLVAEARRRARALAPAALRRAP